MVKRIYKWVLYTNHEAETVINVPLGSKLIHIGLQGKEINAWFEVDPDETETVNVVIVCMYTGNRFVSDNLVHVKSVIESPTYVVHFYIRREFEDFLKEGDMSL